MIVFSQLPKVAYDPMNDVHAEEVELLNTIESLLASEASEENIGSAVEALFDHTREHFANEERLMREVGFPPYMMHKNEHDRVLNEFQLTVMDWRTKKDNSILRNYFSTVIPPWLHQHISSMDTVTAQFISMVKKD